MLETAVAIHQTQLNTKSGKSVFKCYSIFRIDLWREKNEENRKREGGTGERKMCGKRYWMNIRSNFSVCVFCSLLHSMWIYLHTLHVCFAMNIYFYQSFFFPSLGTTQNWIRFVSGALIFYIKGRKWWIPEIIFYSKISKNRIFFVSSVFDISSL